MRKNPKLYDRAKSELIIGISEYAKEYPTLAKEVNDALKTEEFVSDVKLGVAIDIKSLMSLEAMYEVYELFMTFEEYDTEYEKVMTETEELKDAYYEI